MRHPESAVKMTRQISIFGHQNSWRITGKTLTVSNEVSLIVISAVYCRFYPVTPSLSKHTENVVKTLDAAKELRRETHCGMEATLQLTDAEAKFLGEGGQIRAAFRQSYPADSLLNQKIAAARDV
jgi:hypothetical protein